MLPEIEKFNEDLIQWGEDFHRSVRKATEILLFGLCKPLFDEYPRIKTISFGLYADYTTEPESPFYMQDFFVDSQSLFVNDCDFLDLEAYADVKGIKPLLNNKEELSDRARFLFRQLDNDTARLDFNLVGRAFEEQNSFEQLIFTIHRDGRVKVKFD